MVINIVSHVERCYSNEDGETIKNIIVPFLKNNEQVTVSFEKTNGVTSSFVNTAFIELLEEFSFETIKSNLRFINTTRQINKMIRDRFLFEVKKRESLVNA